ncbi:MAG TPA: GlxA family transcriptional regulator [Candidatus Acidoferrales bacterium]|nr:GlxA family transcriptional regulator [Candidatus Acidoferrales bacterium]
MQVQSSRRAKVTRLNATSPSITRRIAILIYPGTQSLDVIGPLEVFAGANQYCREQNPQVQPPYLIEVVASRPGPVRMGSGVQICADRAYASLRGKIDTLIVSGGEVRQAAKDRQLRSWLQATARRSRRLASVCTGAFILGEAGLLNGRRATTHWLGIPQFRRRYPQVDVEADAIYVCDGNVYTSAGVTAGIDLALALVEEDLGHAVALQVARRLVVFLKRPGGQSQFSSHLAAQTVAQGPLRDLPEWIVDHLDDDLSIEALAARAAMSPRNFARVFLRHSGTTPAKYVERARLDAARRFLEDDGLSLEEVAGRCGFASGEHMRRTFLRHLRVVPMDYRRRFRAAS